MNQQNQQKQLDFTRGEKLKLVRTVPLPHTLSQVSEKCMRNLLKCLEEHCGKSACCIVGEDTLAGELGYNERHIRRALRALESLSLLAIEARSSRRGRTASRYQIIWSNLRPDDIGSGQQPDILAAGATGHGAPATGHGAPATGHDVRALNRLFEPVLEPSPPAGASAIATVTRMQGWAEVEKELVDLGMGDARTAIAAALDHRCPPEFLRALIAHYRIHADGWESVGALYYRILTAYPDQDPADATRWLPFRAGYRTPQAIEAERLAAVERVLREREAEESRQRQRAADLSADARLAELSGDELDELIDRAFGPSAKRELCRREWKRSGLAGLAMFRGPLVAALSEGAAR